MKRIENDKVPLVKYKLHFFLNIHNIANCFDVYLKVFFIYISFFLFNLWRSSLPVDGSHVGIGRGERERGWEDKGLDRIFRRGRHLERGAERGEEI